MVKLHRCAVQHFYRNPILRGEFRPMAKATNLMFDTEAFKVP